MKRCALWAAIVCAYWFGLVVPWMPAARPIGNDLHGYFFPKYVLASQLGGWWQLPLWNPYELNGVPLLGMSQPAALYPVRMLLFGMLPPDLALHAFVVTHYVILGAGCFLLASSLRMGRSGSWVLTLVVVTQPMMLVAGTAVHWLASFAWVPFALAGAVRLADAPDGAAVLLTAVAMIMQLFAGYPEFVLDTSIALLVVWALTLTGNAYRGQAIAMGRSSVALGVAGLATVLVGAPMLCAFVEAYGQSIREGLHFAYSPYEMMGVRGSPLRRLIGVYFLVPPPVLLGLALAIGIGIGGRRLAHRGALLGLLTLSIAGLTVLPFVPPFSMSRSTVLCWSTLAHVALGGLAGMGLDSCLAARETGALRPLRAQAACALVAAAAAFYWYGWPARLALVGSLAALATVAWGPRRLWLLAVASLLALIVVRDESPVSVQRKYVYPSMDASRLNGKAIIVGCRLASGGRIVSPVETFTGVLPLNQLASPQGYPESMLPRHLDGILRAAGLGMTNTGRVDWLQVIRHRSLLDLLDVRCIIAPPWLAPHAVKLGFRPGDVVTDDGRLAYYRTGQAARLVGRSEVMSEEQMFQAVEEPRFDPGEVVVTTEGPALTGEAGTLITLGRTAPGRHLFRTVSRDAGYLVIFETWYPGWRARIDGVTAPVTRVDAVLLGVLIPPGTHEVEAVYWPRGMSAALAAAAGGSLLLLGLAVSAARTYRRTFARHG